MYVAISRKLLYYIRPYLQATMSSASDFAGSISALVDLAKDMLDATHPHGEMCQRILKVAGDLSSSQALVREAEAKRKAAEKKKADRKARKGKEAKEGKGTEKKDAPKKKRPASASADKLAKDKKPKAKKAKGDKGKA